jgi:hypothetical protein
MTIKVDDRGDKRAALSPSQRQAPPIEALWYQAWRLSAKGWSTKKVIGPMKKQWAADQSPPPTAFSSLSFVSLASPRRLKALQITGYRSGFSYFSTLYTLFFQTMRIGP